MELINTVEETILELVSGTDAIIKTKAKKYTKYIDALKEERFINRLNYFVFDDYVDKDSKEEFLKNINREQKSILVSLIAKALDTTYDIQAFILSCIYKKMRYKELNYLDKVVFSNIDLIVQEDFELLYFYVKKDENTELEKIDDNSSEIYIIENNSFAEQVIKKFISLGIFVSKPENNTRYSLEEQIFKKSNFGFGYTKVCYEIVEYLDDFFDYKEVNNILKRYTIKKHNFYEW